MFRVFIRVFMYGLSKQASNAQFQERTQCARSQRCMNSRYGMTDMDNNNNICFVFIRTVAASKQCTVSRYERNAKGHRSVCSRLSPQVVTA